MNEMTDNNIDSLIRETFERRVLLADLDRLIIADVRRQARRELIRRWARVAAVSFGLPVVLLVFAACMYLYIEQYGTSDLHPLHHRTSSSRSHILNSSFS